MIILGEVNIAANTNKTIVLQNQGSKNICETNFLPKPGLLRIRKEKETIKRSTSSPTMNTLQGSGFNSQFITAKHWTVYIGNMRIH